MYCSAPLTRRPEADPMYTGTNDSYRDTVTPPNSERAEAVVSRVHASIQEGFEKRMKHRVFHWVAPLDPSPANCQLNPAPSLHLIAESAKKWTREEGYPLLKQFTKAKLG